MKMRESFDELVASSGIAGQSSRQTEGRAQPSLSPAVAASAPQDSRCLASFVRHCANGSQKLRYAGATIQTTLRIALVSRWLSPQQYRLFASFQHAQRSALRASAIRRAERRDLYQYACLSWLSFALTYWPQTDNRPQNKLQGNRQSSHGKAVGLPDLLLSDLLMARGWFHLAHLSQQTIAKTKDSKTSLPDEKSLALWRNIARIHKQYYRSIATGTEEALFTWQEALLNLLRAE